MGKIIDKKRNDDQGNFMGGGGEQGGGEDYSLVYLFTKVGI